MRARLWAAAMLAVGLVVFPATSTAALVTLEWHGAVQLISGPAPSPPVTVGDPVHLRLVLYDEPAFSGPLAGSSYGPGPYTGQTFYWYPASIHAEVGTQVLDIAPPPPFIATTALSAYTVVRNDAPFGGTEFIDSVQVMYEGLNGLYGGIWFQMSSIRQQPFVETLSSGSLSEAVAKAALFDYSSLEVQLGAVGSAEGYYTVAAAPLINGAPEPATLALVGLGLAGLAASRRRKQ